MHDFISVDACGERAFVYSRNLQERLLMAHLQTLKGIVQARKQSWSSFTHSEEFKNNPCQSFEYNESREDKKGIK